MESDEPVPFSQFGLEGWKDRHLQRVLERLGQPTRLRCYDTPNLARVWLHYHTRQGSEWESLSPEMRQGLSADLLETLYLKAGGFEALFDVLFRCVRSSPVLDVLRTGLEHSFHKDGQLLNVLDFPLINASWIGDDCIRNLCRCTRSPLFAAFYCGKPEALRLLLNCGAVVPRAEDVCRCCSWACHPLEHVFVVFVHSDEANRRRNHLCLQLLLVDATAALRHYVRCSPWGLDELVEETPSLQHAARACIRRQLRAARTIGRPGALDTCGLPRALKAYVYAEELKTEDD